MVFQTYDFDVTQPYDVNDDLYWCAQHGILTSNRHNKQSNVYQTNLMVQNVPSVRKPLLGCVTFGEFNYPIIDKGK